MTFSLDKRLQANSDNKIINQPITLLKDIPQKTKTIIPLQNSISFGWGVKSYGSKSLAGKYISGISKTNQDSCLMIKDFNGTNNCLLLAVLDGHGTNGHLVSEYAKKRFPINIEQSCMKSLKCASTMKSSIAYAKERKHTKVVDESTMNAVPMLQREVILDAFKRTNNDLRLSNINITYSGTTLVSVLLIGNYIVCANVGDSRAIVGSYKNSTHWQARAISHDHKPDIPAEYERIMRSNGRVECYVDEFGNSVGPKRVWKRYEDLPGLAMSRALGDKSAAEAGVIPIPDIIEERIKEEDKILVLASDGIWEHMNNIEVINLLGELWETGNAKVAAEKLVEEARSRWDEEDAIDDITAIIVFLN